MFSSVTDVRTALTPGAVSDSSTAASLPDTQIVDAIAQADAKITGYLPTGYTVPVQTVEQGDPAAPVEVAVNLIRFWSRDIAAYLATLTFMRNKDVPADDPVRLRYNSTMMDLQAVASGKFVLPVDADTTDDGSDVVVYNQYEGRMFGLEDFNLVSGVGQSRYEQHIHDRGW